ncbi:MULTISPECIES: hypothetical protein [Microbacterium]|jgi:hypothetical protein|uniref:hypothetical protein n=1 Tax=Microbacterium TaxID=33882 RepID=UPI00278AF229|nr:MULTISPECIES: hypothetical protein [Microbacterium]MDQ1084718.1 hypothetical protein [Microbacterium sp. SORGH_AS_0344]MDQ1170005.1 hypothetical protein [Microbacterium proteolyticum]
MTTDTSSTASKPHTTPTPSAYPNPLGLTSVLPGSLPPRLGTLTAPNTYQVDAVFNRRPQAEEVTALHSPTTQQALSDAGYPSVTLRVSDRRLEIANTNLEELKSGLATFLADHLAAITAKIQKDHLTAHARLAAAAEAEASRADAIAREAGLITFEQTPATP